MKKRGSKLHLSRETLRSLDRDLRQIVGAETQPSDCIGCYPTIWSECISGCIVCPQEPPGGHSLRTC